MRYRPLRQAGAAPVLPARAKAEALRRARADRAAARRRRRRGAERALRGASASAAAGRRRSLAAFALPDADHAHDPNGAARLPDGAAPEARRDALLARSQAARGARMRDRRDLMRAAAPFPPARMALLIALADIGGVWDVETVTAALTATADIGVRAGD